MRPENPTTLAAKLGREENPRGGADVEGSTEVRYDAGTSTDPVTGQPVHVTGLSTSASLGVSPDSSTPPEVANRDREIIERELYEKGLPEAKVSIPVAGYLYFPVPNAKKDAKYQLVYSGKNEPLTLLLSQ